jgi:hypothetical protein
MFSSPIAATLVFAGLLLQAFEESVNAPFSFQESGYGLRGEGLAPRANTQAFE